eukprot:gene31812-28933_t
MQLQLRVQLSRGARPLLWPLVRRGINHLEASGICSVIDVIKQIRKDRGGLVQHREQAHFVQKALEDYVEENSADDPDEVLQRSVDRAEKAKPPTFTMHSSQLDTGEGTDEEVPHWRVAQLEAKHEREEEEYEGIDTAAGRRFWQKQRLKEQKRLEVLEKLEFDDLPLLQPVIPMAPVTGLEAIPIGKMSANSYATLGRKSGKHARGSVIPVPAAATAKSMRKSKGTFGRK